MEQLPTKEQKRIAELAEQVYDEVDELARNQDSYDFGLPMFKKETGPIEKALTAEAVRAMPLVQYLEKLHTAIDGLFEVKNQKGSATEKKYAWNHLANVLWDSKKKLSSYTGEQPLK